MIHLLSLAMAFESDPAHVVLEDRAELFTNSEYSTGIIPSGSPIGVEFHIEANGGVNTKMEGDGKLSWPDALTLAFTGEAQTGLMRLDGSLAAVTQIEIDLSQYGYQGNFEIDRREISFDGTKFFDPFVMDGAITDRVEIVDTTDSTQLIYYDYEIITGLSLRFSADMTPTFTAGFEGVSWVNNEGFASTEGQTMDLAPEEVASYEVDSTFRGAYDSNFALVFTPQIDACAAIIGCITVAQFDFPIDLITDRFEQDFASQVLSFPLPLLHADLSEGDFGDVTPGTQSTINLSLTNDGDLSAYGTATIEGSVDFYIFPNDFNALPGTADGLTITFAPIAEGEQTATLVLASNDPSHPELQIPLMGNGFIDDSEVDAGGNVEEDITKEVGTCGCASTAEMGWTPLLGVGLLLMLRRRR
jgi:MYXO-CTERM domain-containing protein